MTRPKADSDPWLTDMVSRDKEIAKTVVYGIREIISLLRGIRDEMALSQRARDREISQLRDEVIALYRAQGTPQSTHTASWRDDVPACDKAGCSLPLGHYDAHRGSLRNG